MTKPSRGGEAGEAGLKFVHLKLNLVDLLDDDQVVLDLLLVADESVIAVAEQVGERILGLPEVS